MAGGLARCGRNCARTRRYAGATGIPSLFLKAQKTYISKLWSGRYFRYDTQPANQDAIQTDQLVGQWYANMLGLSDFVPRSMQMSALRTIYDYNVMKFGDGKMGDVNGMTTSGAIIDNPEGKEVWVGTTEAYAALLKSDGMQQEAYNTLWGFTTSFTRGRVLVSHA